MTGKYKFVKVSSKRQFTIPKKFYDALQISEQVKCYMEGDRLVIEPARTDSFFDFSSDILRELVSDNYSGDALLSEFEARKAKVAESLEKIAEEAVEDIKNGKSVAAEEVFRELLGDEDV